MCSTLPYYVITMTFFSHMEKDLHNVWQGGKSQMLGISQMSVTFHVQLDIMLLAMPSCLYNCSLLQVFEHAMV